MSKPLIGAHVSTAGGLEKGIEKGIAIGAQCIQIFGSSPQQWATRMPTAAQAETFKTALGKSAISEVYLHAAYLVNIASPNKYLRESSIKSLSDHLQIAGMIGARGLIYHIGTGKELPKEEAYTYVTEGMLRILDNVPGDVCLIMENSATTKKIGATAAELGQLHKAAGSTRIKICMDTAHALESGMILQYTTEIIKDVVDIWEREIGLHNIVALHVNDSKTPANSQHDRHENIGKGYIGLEGFKNLARETRLHDKAWLLEVPGYDEKGPDKQNIDILQSCFE